MRERAPGVPFGERAAAVVPPELRRAVGKGILRLRLVTQRWRGLPDTLIVGTMRGGTTSLFRWLAAHPDVRASLRKEVDFFSTEHHRGEAWYRSHFPLGWQGRDPGPVRRRVEASPDYLLDPRAPARAASLLPEARIVALLREPVDRAVSHHRVQVRLGGEHLGLMEAIEAEPERLAPAWRALETDPEGPLPRPLIDWSYAARGRYAEQLARWLAHYPRQQVLVLRSEDLYERPEVTYGSVLRFLGLRPWRPRAFAAYSWDRSSVAGAGRASDSERRLLEPVFAAPNEALRALPGWGTGWR